MRLTNWERTTTLYALVRLLANPPLKSPAPQAAADAKPSKMTENPDPIIRLDKYPCHQEFLMLLGMTIMGANVTFA
jgi:hypothetical protein